MNLSIISLANNRIRFINGELFRPLSKLTHVHLISNLCINENFDSATQIAALQRTVNEKCHFHEAGVINTAPGNDKELDEIQSQIMEIESTLQAENHRLQSELSAAQTENIKGKRSLEACKQNVEEKSTEIARNFQRIQELQTEVNAKNAEIQQLKITNEAVNNIH